MLPGFEDITKDIKPAEEVFIKTFMVPALKLKIGQENAVTNKVMREKLFTYTGIKISDPKMRKYIQFIRIFNLVPKLCSTKKGYFVDSDGAEFEKWKDSMRKRVNEMNYVLESVEYWNNGGEKL